MKSIEKKIWDLQKMMAVSRLESNHCFPKIFLHHLRHKSFYGSKVVRSSLKKGDIRVYKRK
jgi:hypothetical protein